LATSLGEPWRIFKDGAGVGELVPPEEAPPPEDREPRLARRSPFAPATKLCPRCLTQLKQMGGLGGWLIPMDYYCPNCGYSGTVFVEKESSDTQGER